MAIAGYSLIKTKNLIMPPILSFRSLPNNSQEIESDFTERVLHTERKEPILNLDIMNVEGSRDILQNEITKKIRAIHSYLILK